MGHERRRRKQLEKLKAEGDPIMFRATEVGARAAAQERADKFVAAAKDAITSWPDKKPWIDEKERKAASKQVGRPQSGPPHAVPGRPRSACCRLRMMALGQICHCCGSNGKQHASG